MANATKRVQRRSGDDYYTQAFHGEATTRILTILTALAALAVGAKITPEQKKEIDECKDLFERFGIVHVSYEMFGRVQGQPGFDKTKALRHLGAPMLYLGKPGEVGPNGEKPTVILNGRVYTKGREPNAVLTQRQGGGGQFIEYVKPAKWAYDADDQQYREEVLKVKPGEKAADPVGASAGGGQASNGDDDIPY